MIGVQTSIKYGMPWGVVLTHELFEMLVDPESSAANNTTCQTDPGTGTATNCTFYAHETADPVQGEWWRLGPVRVSDYVYRNWFIPGAPGPYDAGRHVGAPLQLAPRSYAIFYADGYWQTENTFTARGFRGGDWDRFFRG